MNYQIENKQSDILYGIEFNIKVPCEIRVNDLIVVKNIKNGVIGPEIINQYLIKPGNQVVNIKVYLYRDNRTGKWFQHYRSQRIEISANCK